MSGEQVRLTGRVRVALPPEEAFRLFTPLGERDWAPGWEPHFPSPTADDADPGTVFETGAHGATTTWLVLDRRPGRHISYARVTPDVWAGTVAVTLDDAGGHSDVSVTYALTALRPSAAPGLEDFARGYPEYLQSWEDAIAARLYTVS
ncbi:SRPBCC family protein [Actinomadura sp. DC4]|uniref:SRPBCC family protein n=1 Tax=Actinomadura sp. DC4 TaxID=3055069 RepID=UPI0025B134AB|nr:SRPBCC family protein [Actinomadura sp. DC4]MDN3359596.1 SRPBCC family protein [Actinomadura sp. DC4]